MKRAGCFRVINPLFGENGIMSDLGPRFTIIVLNWNGKHFLECCLGSLRSQSFRDFETILVDNGSTDGSVEFVRERFSEVQIVPLKENRGFCAGNNEGMRRARGRWLVLLNNDTEVVPDFLTALDEASRLFANAGMLACKMLFAESRCTIDNCGFTLSRAGTAQEIGRNEPDTGQYRLGLEPFGPSGEQLLTSEKCLIKLGSLTRISSLFTRTLILRCEQGCRDSNASSSLRRWSFTSTAPLCRLFLNGRYITDRGTLSGCT